MKTVLFYILLGFAYICVNTQKNLKILKEKSHKSTKKNKPRKLAKNETIIVKNFNYDTPAENNTDYILKGFDGYKRISDDVDPLTNFIVYIFHDSAVERPKEVKLYAELKFNDSSKDGVAEIICSDTHREGSITSAQCTIYRNDVKSIKILDTMEISDKNMTIPHTSYADYQLKEGVNKFTTNILHKLNESSEVVLNNSKIISQSPYSFTLRGNLTNERFLNSKNIKLFLVNGGNGLNATCNSEANAQKDANCEMSCTIGKVADSNLNNTLVFMPNDEFLLVNFKEGEKSVVNYTDDPNVNRSYKQRKKGLPTGAIIAIIIPTVLILLGITALAFAYKRNPTPPQAIAYGNNTLGAVNSSTNVVSNQ